MGIAADYSIFGVDEAVVRDMAARDEYFADLVRDYWALVERIGDESGALATELGRRRTRLHDMIADILIAEAA